MVNDRWLHNLISIFRWFIATSQLNFMFFYIFFLFWNCLWLLSECNSGFIRASRTQQNKKIDKNSLNITFKSMKFNLNRRSAVIDRTCADHPADHQILSILPPQKKRMSRRWPIERQFRHQLTKLSTIPFSTHRKKKTSHLLNQWIIQPNNNQLSDQ